MGCKVFSLCRGIDRLVRQTIRFGKSTIKSRYHHFRQRILIAFEQYGIHCISVSVPGDQDSGLFRRQASWRRLASSFSGFAVKMPLSFAQLQKISLVKLYNPVQALYNAFGIIEYTVSPSKGCVPVDAALCGSRSDSFAIDNIFHKIRPYFLMSQAGKRCAC